MSRQREAGVFLVFYSAAPSELNSDKEKSHGPLDKVVWWCRRGCREAMRESYKKHIRDARKNGTTASSPHVAGLYGALGTRYIARGAPVAEVILWGELAPFLVMKEAEAVEALAEYVVFQERPKDVRKAWLKKAINSGLRSSRDNSRIAMAVAGLINRVAWCALLEPDTIKAIEDAVEKLRQS